MTDGTEAGGGAAGDSPALRIVRGAPTLEELAVITAVVAAASAGGGEDRRWGASGAGSGGEDDRIQRRGRWNDPAVGHRRSWRAGPGAWRASVR